jgi:hypothetical protein
MKEKEEELKEKRSEEKELKEKKPEEKELKEPPSFVKQCLDVLHRDDVKKQCKVLITPLIDFIWYEIHPYIYLIFSLILLIFVMIFMILMLLLFILRKQIFKRRDYI